MRSRRRRGFTLIELLVVISIIGVLVGLLLPAINSARESGRRAQCQSQLRQAALGLLGYVNTQNQFPAAGTFGRATATLPTDPTGAIVPGWMPGATTPTTGDIPMFSWVVEILPYIDNQELYNQWTKYDPTSTPPGAPVAYVNALNFATAQASNLKLGDTPIGILKCPNDNTTQTGQGNLSYVVNGGFALWHALPFGWAGNDIGGQAANPNVWVNPASYSTPDQGLLLTRGVTQKLGVMFLEEQYINSTTGKVYPAPWNVKSTLTGIQDGASNTILLAENTLAGAGTGDMTYSKGLVTNWASPLPTFTMFIGSDNVCGSASGGGNCYDISSANLNPTGDTDGSGWARSNQVGTFENINFGQALTIEGSFPFANSAHPSGGNFAFCDGRVQFIRNTIDGTVYSKILTSGGSKLPAYLRQLPVEQDAISQ